MDQKNKIRVVVADDSAFIRHYLTELFRVEPSIEVVGVAKNADEVIRLSFELHPDVITMDYHMPGKTGVEAAGAIMLGVHPLPGIIMLSAFEGKEGKEVQRMLESSGAQVVAKPSGEVSLDIDKISAVIVEKVKEVGESVVRMRTASTQIEHFFPHEAGSHRPQLTTLVIGASTGGPPLVEHLLSSLDPKLKLAVVVVQHMSRYFTGLFAERLDRVTNFQVKEAATGDTPSPGHVLVVPGGMALSYRNGADGNTKEDPKFIVIDASYHEESIDKTMTAVASYAGVHACAVLLSGMGSDGTEGLRAIKENGGYTIVQEPASATVSSMPLHAINDRVVDEVLPVEVIPDHIAKKILETK